MSPALTAAAQAASSINSKHRDVQRLGRTAKEIAAEIGEELIKVKDDLGHGEFMPWVADNCSFKDRAANNYMKIAKTKIARPCEFAICESIADVLSLGKPKPTPKPELRAATLDDLRKVERLRALRDSPAASEGERDAAQRKLDAIEREVGKVEPKPETPKGQPTGQSPRHAVRLRACAVLDKVAPTLTGNPRSMIISALMIAYGDTPDKIEELLEALKGTQ